MDKSLRFVGLGFWLSWILLRAESPCLFLSSLSVVTKLLYQMDSNGFEINCCVTEFHLMQCIVMSCFFSLFLLFL